MCRSAATSAQQRAQQLDAQLAVAQAQLAAAQQAVQAAREECEQQRAAEGGLAAEVARLREQLEVGGELCSLNCTCVYAAALQLVVPLHPLQINPINIYTPPQAADEAQAQLRAHVAELRQQQLAAASGADPVAGTPKTAHAAGAHHQAGAVAAAAVAGQSAAAALEADRTTLAAEAAPGAGAVAAGCGDELAALRAELARERAAAAAARELAQDACLQLHVVEAQAAARERALADAAMGARWGSSF